MEKRPDALRGSPFIPRLILFAVLNAVGDLMIAHALVIPRLQGAMETAQVKEVPRLVEFGIRVSMWTRNNFWIRLIAILGLMSLGWCGVLDDFLPAFIVIGLIAIVALSSTLFATCRFGSQFVPHPGWEFQRIQRTTTR